MRPTSGGAAATRRSSRTTFGRPVSRRFPTRCTPQSCTPPIVKVSFIYRYILHASCSQFDSLPLPSFRSVSGSVWESALDRSSPPADCIRSAPPAARARSRRSGERRRGAQLRQLPRRAAAPGVPLRSRRRRRRRLRHQPACVLRGRGAAAPRCARGQQCRRRNDAAKTARRCSYRCVVGAALDCRRRACERDGDCPREGRPRDGVRAEFGRAFQWDGVFVCATVSSVPSISLLARARASPAPREGRPPSLSLLFASTTKYFYC